VLITRGLVERLEAVEVEVDARLARALATVTNDPAVAVHPLGRGVLIATGPDRYVNRAVGITLDALGPDDVDEVVGWYSDRGLPAAVQLSPWAPALTVASLGSGGFLPRESRSVLVRPTVDAGPVGGAQVRLVQVDDATAADARDVMAAEAGPDRSVSDEFMAADRACEGTVQLLALLGGRPVGCGSMTTVGGTAWLGAASTVPDARRRGVQAALVAHRLDLAREQGCHLVGATATVGSDSARNLQRLGFRLVQDQWVLAQPRRR